MLILQNSRPTSVIFFLLRCKKNCWLLLKGNSEPNVGKSQYQKNSRSFVGYWASSAKRKHKMTVYVVSLYYHSDLFERDKPGKDKDDDDDDEDDSTLEVKLFSFTTVFYMVGGTKYYHKKT